MLKTYKIGDKNITFYKEGPLESVLKDIGSFSCLIVAIYFSQNSLIWSVVMVMFLFAYIVCRLGKTLKNKKEVSKEGAIKELKKFMEIK